MTYWKVSGVNENPSRPGRGDPHAVSAVGVVEHLLQQRPQHHRESQIQHSEEDFAVADHEQSDDQAKNRRRYATEHEIEQDIAAADILAPERRGVGAGGKEHRVPERHLSRLQQHDDAEHHDALGQDQRQQRRHARHEQRRQRCDQKEDDGDRRDRLMRPAIRFSSPGWRRTGLRDAPAAPPP